MTVRNEWPSLATANCTKTCWAQLAETAWARLLTRSGDMVTYRRSRSIGGEKYQYRKGKAAFEESPVNLACWCFDAAL